MTIDDRIKITEEVPGVPEDERWFVSGGPFKAKKNSTHPYPHFSTRKQAEQFLTNQGILLWEIEYYEL